MSLSVKQNKPALFVGAFVALVHLIASNPEKVDPDELGLEGRALFMHAIVMRVTAMRQDESYKVGEDEQLYWCYWALDGFLREADETSSARYALMDILNVGCTSIAVYDILLTAADVDAVSRSGSTRSRRTRRIRLRAFSPSASSPEHSYTTQTVTYCAAMKSCSKIS